MYNYFCPLSRSAILPGDEVVLFRCSHGQWDTQALMTWEEYHHRHPNDENHKYPIEFVITGKFDGWGSVEGFNINKPGNPRECYCFLHRPVVEQLLNRPKDFRDNPLNDLTPQDVMKLVHIAHSLGVELNIGLLGRKLSEDKNSENLRLIKQLEYNQLINSFLHRRIVNWQTIRQQAQDYQDQYYNRK